MVGAARRNSEGPTEGDGDAGSEREALPTLEHPSFMRIASAQPLEFTVGRTSRVAIEFDALDGHLAMHADARVVFAIDPPLAAEFARATDSAAVARERVCVCSERSAAKAP